MPTSPKSSSTDTRCAALNRFIGEFHPDQRSLVGMRQVSFARAGSRIVAVRHINHPMGTLYQKVRENQRKQRQLAKRAKHRKGKAAARATVHHSGLLRASRAKAVLSVGNPFNQEVQNWPR